MADTSKPIIDVRLHETEGRQLIRLTEDVTHTIRLRGARPVAVFELPSAACFPPGSALLSPAPLAVRQPSALFVLATALRFGRENGELNRLLIAGHAAPEELSAARAKGVRALVAGDREAWAALTADEAEVADEQRYLRFAAQSQGWDSDPGPADGIRGPNTRRARDAFRRGYAERFGGAVGGGDPLGPEDWAAMLDLLERRLARWLGLEADGLAEVRAGVPPVEPAAVGCGEHWPLDRLRIREHTLTADARVDLLLFAAPDLPALACHTSAPCAFARCDLYRKGRYTSITAAGPQPSGRAQRLELSDLHFHTDSAVFLPGEAAHPGAASEQVDPAVWEAVRAWEELFNGGRPSLATHARRQTVFVAEGARPTGIGALAELLRFVRDHPDRSVLVAGHTDRVGSQAYNRPLSLERGQGVAALLAGDREAFLDACDAYHVPRDDVEILRYMCASRGWTCDPGEGETAPPSAIEAFQEDFNQDLASAPIGVDGVVGRETRGAYYDVYDDDLARFLGGAERRDEARRMLMWVDARQRAIGCGESFPREQPAQDEVASEENRRVEVLFFEPHELPPEVTPSGESIYAADYTFEPLLAPPPEEPEVEALADDDREPPEADVEVLVADLPVADGQVDAAEDPWDFLEHFVPHHPGRFGAQLGELGGAEPPDLPPGGTPSGSVRIQGVDARFAPGPEDLILHYACRGLGAQELTLRITSAHHTGPLHEQTLTAAGRSDGAHTLAWDGRASAGELSGRLLHPLLSPYTVSLLVDGEAQAEASFEVVYHSLELTQGPWIPDPDTPPPTGSRAWAQLRLNELGYHAGPVGAELDRYLEKAVRSYKGAHRALFAELDDAAAAEALSPALLGALEAGDNPRPLLDPGLPGPDEEARLWLDAPLLPEIGDPTVAEKMAHERSVLNRPLVPLEARIFLRGKDGGRVEAPEAVGPVGVAWSALDAPKPPVAIAELPTAPSHTRAYVEQALASEGGGSGADNCHRNLGGIRGLEPPWLIGDAYAPHQVTRRDAVAISTANVDHPQRRGRAGVMLRPSIIAGDAYQVRAQLDFEGLPNQEALEAAHSEVRAELGTLRVQRVARIAAVVHWAPSRISPFPLDTVREEFGFAELRIDADDVPVLGVEELLTPDEYLALVTANVTEVQDHPDRIGELPFDPERVVGRSIRDRQPDETFADYAALVGSRLIDVYEELQQPAAVAVATEVWRRHGPGFVVFNISPHRPVDLRQDTSDADHPHREYVYSQSRNFERGAVFVNFHDDEDYGRLTAHEMAHLLFQQHWENASDAPNLEYRDQHDQDDHNCLMSYALLADDPLAATRPWQIEGNRTTHFCGKCNLLFRGWNVVHAALPSGSGATP